ncbi:MAG: class I SAM-dependent methyltransferase [Desulfobacterales bacterium]|nr:MAG: class I SAM-dependent methyltransferase [Desulfobacterales bacterium]
MTAYVILDVGCGQGLALELFANHGFIPIGITLEKEELKICRQKGFEVYAMDQSFLDFANESFDFIWCRHCLEHSIFPFYTLGEFFRVLKSKRFLYVEVPAPDTSCEHQTNQNHYIVLGQSAWIELIKRTGFHLTNVFNIDFKVDAGFDRYHVFIQRKP